MQINKIRTTYGKSEVTFSADFLFRNPQLNTRVWFKVPRKYVENVNIHNALLVAAAPLAVSLNEDLFINAPVSKKLAANLKKISPFIGLAKNTLRLHVKAVVEEKQKEGIHTGLFFTLGIDSFYSLVHSLKQPLHEHIKYLVFIQGLEVFPISKILAKKMETRFQKTAHKTKTEMIFIDTNIRTVSDKILNWEYYHGAAIAAAGHLLTGELNTLYISSCDDYMLPIPWGTTKGLDPLWSSEQLQFKSAGAGIYKFDKIKEITHSPLCKHVLETMWVCWEKLPDASFENCSMCEKCFRIHLAFLANGIKKKIPTFKPIDIEAFSRAPILENCLITWERIYTNLKKNKNVDPAVIIILGNKIKHVKRFHLFRACIKPIQKYVFELRKVVADHVRNIEPVHDAIMIFQGKRNLLQ